MQTNFLPATLMIYFVCVVCVVSLAWHMCGRLSWHYDKTLQALNLIRRLDFVFHKHECTRSWSYMHVDKLLHT